MRKAISTETLLQKWAPMLEAGEKIQSKSTKKALAQIFENTAEDFAKHGLITEGYKTTDGLGKSPIDGNKSTGYLTGKFGREGTDAGTMDQNMYLPNVIMPMVRRIFPSLIAHELVGVQALNGPVGYALAYRAKLGGYRGENPDATAGGLGNNRYTPTAGALGDREMAFAPVDTRYTGKAGLSSFGALSSTENEAWKAYAGTETGMKAWNGQGVSTSDGEYLDYRSQVPTVGFDFLKTMVEARTRKLGAGWSPELAEDMEAMHGFDVESEFVNMISYEIGAEIDRQLITEMVKTAITGNSVTEWDPSLADGLDQMGRLATLLTQVTIEANQIAIRTRRGHANFVVTSPRVTALLEQLSMNKFVSIQNTTKDAPSVPDSGVGVLAKVGLINDGQQLLIRDTYAAGNYILMGYKGSHPADSGIIYCPYIPVQLQKVVDPFTLTPMVGARTRYGIMNSVWDAKNYYSFINVKIDNGATPYEFGKARRFVQDYSEVKNGTLFV